MNSIQEFYAGKTIFITGGSGFMGKVLIEKLLYSCSEVKELIILVRSKRGKTPQQRVGGFAKLPLFKRIVEEKPEQLEKISIVCGEVTKPNFDLSEENLKKVTETTEIMIHLAASLKLEATLKPNILTNLLGTKYALDVAKQMKNLIQMIHLSTAFCNVEPEIAEEKVYDCDGDPLQLMKSAEVMSEKEMEEMQASILGRHPNTYTYTKRLSEILVRDEYGALPVCIVRPSIVSPAAFEPVPGWVDSLNGPVGILYAAGKGVLRSLLVNPNAYFEMIPVDTAIAALIVIAKTEATISERPVDVPVYHLTVFKSRQITYRRLLDEARVLGYKYPLSLALWHPNGNMTQSRLVHNVNVFLFQWIPAYLIDFLLFVFRQKRFMVHIQERIAKGCEVIEFVSMRNWNLNADKFHGLSKTLTPDEYEMFKIDTQNLGDEMQYMEDCVLGTRQYCVRDPMSNLGQARFIAKIQYVVHIFCRCLFWYFVIKALLNVFGIANPVDSYFQSAN